MLTKLLVHCFAKANIIEKQIYELRQGASLALEFPSNVRDPENPDFFSNITSYILSISSIQFKHLIYHNITMRP